MGVDSFRNALVHLVLDTSDASKHLLGVGGIELLVRDQSPTRIGERAIGLAVNR